MKRGFRRNRVQARGFTAVEALVSVVVLSILVLAAATMFQSSNRMSRKATIQGDSQQSARLAIDLVTRDLRSIGYGIEREDGQRALVHGGPWDVVFNSNAFPLQDDPLAPGFPGALDPALAPSALPGGLYAPAKEFTTGAETIRYTLDSSSDGVIDGNDVGDDPMEATPNPRDYVLFRETYGELADGTNGGAGQEVALVRGPDADPDGTLPPPLFSYWLDDDDDLTTDPILHGDLDGDGQLSQGEIAVLGPVPNVDLALVSRIVVNVTAEDGETGGRPDYRTRTLTSSVSMRNEIRRHGLILGKVFEDADADAVYDADENPIPNVTVRLNTGIVSRSDSNGRYFFQVAPGAYTVTEFDPSGYVSTTANSVALSVQTGLTSAVDFGDRPASGVGTIEGITYDDQNLNALRDADEPGIANVVVTLNTGLADTTDVNGYFSFEVGVGAYTVVETDSVGWSSTTDNVVDVVLTTDGEVVKVAFGDARSGLSGTLQGTVYLDADQDGLFDANEQGIADVPILVSTGDSTVTNGNGGYSITLPPGIYGVLEKDLEGYSSTTPNYVSSVTILPDSTTILDFGDLIDTSLDFTVVTVGQTDRALSIAATDLVEDNRADPDIILGTQLGAASTNLHVWHNARRNSSTAITALFSATPSFSRNAGAPIPRVLMTDSNGDGVDDAITGLDNTVGPNLLTWVTRTGTSAPGTFDSSPSGVATTNSGSSVTAVQRVSWPGWSTHGLLVGTYDGIGAGHLEVWVSAGSGEYTHLNASDLHGDRVGTLGTVTALATGDFDGDGYPDVAIGQDSGLNKGRISVMYGDATDWTWGSGRQLVFATEGAVLSMVGVDMAEDDQNDVDLLVGTSKGSYSGVIELWLNDKGAFGDAGDTGGRVRSDWVDAGGEVLSIDTALLDPDVFPDVIAGIRRNLYVGGLKVYRGIGYLPSDGTEWSHTGSGEVVALTTADFDVDGLTDIAVGTRTALSTGELIVYFNQ